ncbi:MAG: hypothetical protein ACYC1M_18695 [Armatimonadota bacterium]
MKHLVAIALAVICLPAICFSSPDEDALSKAQERYPWLPQEMTVSRMKVTPSRTRYLLMKEKPAETYVVDLSGVLESADWNQMYDKRMYQERNEDFVWQQRPDIPRDKMVLRSSNNHYLLKHKNGLLDGRVMMDIKGWGGVTSGFMAENRLDDRPLPSVNISSDQARKIAENYVKNYVHKTNAGKVMYWPHYFQYDKYTDDASIYVQYSDDAVVETDSIDNLYGYYYVGYKLSVEPIEHPYELTEEQVTKHPFIWVSVNATTGDIVRAHWSAYSCPGIIMGIPTDKPVSKPASVAVEQDGEGVLWGYPCISVDGRMYVPLMAVQSLAKPHTVAARAGDASFKLNGVKLGLPAKVVDRKGIPYLPWQSINSLPGCKAEFDVEGYKLKITTPALKDTAPTAK